MEEISDGRYKEMMFTCTEGVIFKYPKCKIYSEEFINRFIRRYGLDEIYRDYSPYYNKFYDRQIHSFYTPYGISSIDSFICKEICKEDVDVEKWKEIILTQPNLHPIIRNNLYGNLVNMTKWKIKNT
jgi:hypothetical protein